MRIELILTILALFLLGLLFVICIFYDAISKKRKNKRTIKNALKKLDIKFKL